MREEQIRLLRQCLADLDRLLEQEELNRADFSDCVSGEIRSCYVRGIERETDELTLIKKKLLRLLDAEERKLACGL